MFGLEPFQSKVVGVACVVLIVMLSLIGYLLANSKLESNTWPPTIAVCPDYWEDATGTGKHCTNPHNLGKCDISKLGSDGIDLTSWTKPAVRCAASKGFRDECNLSWDGITNDDNACASADSKKKDTSSSMPPYMTMFLVILVVIALMYLLSKRGKTEGATE
jgi:hypothetical protein